MSMPQREEESSNVLPWPHAAPNNAVKKSNSIACVEVDNEGMNRTPADRETIVTIAFLDSQGRSQHNTIRTSMCFDSMDMQLYKAALDNFYAAIGFTILHVQVCTERSVVIQGMRYSKALALIQQGWARIFYIAVTGLAGLAILLFDTYIYDIIPDLY